MDGKKCECVLYLLALIFDSIHRYIKSSHPNVKSSGGTGSLGRIVQVLVDESPPSSSDLSDLILAHRSFSATIQTFVEIQSSLETNVTKQM